MCYVYEFLASLFNSDYDFLILKGISCKGLKEFVESFRVIILFWISYFGFCVLIGRYNDLTGFDGVFLYVIYTNGIYVLCIRIFSHSF